MLQALASWHIGILSSLSVTLIVSPFFGHWWIFEYQFVYDEHSMTIIQRQKIEQTMHFFYISMQSLMYLLWLMCDRSILPKWMTSVILYLYLFFGYVCMRNIQSILKEFDDVVDLKVCPRTVYWWWMDGKTVVRNTP